MKKAMCSMVLALMLAGPAAVAEAKEARAPAHDDMARATVVETLPFSETARTRGASLESDEAQPSCTTIRGSVWYALSVPEDGMVIAEVSSTFPSSTAVLTSSVEESPMEVACSTGTAGSTLEFEAAAGQIYLIQLGATTKKQGLADVSFRMSSWKEITLVDRVVEHKIDEQRLPLARVQGRPRPSDLSMYDVTVTVGDQQRSFGIVTFGLVQQSIDQELVTIPEIATKIRLQITARYDSSQRRCALDDGGETCYLGLPLRDPTWLTGGDGSRAELVVTISATKGSMVLVERSQSIPYAGQVLSLLP